MLLFFLLEFLVIFPHLLNWRLDDWELSPQVKKNKLIIKFLTCVCVQGGQLVPIFLIVVAGCVRRTGRRRKRRQTRLWAHHGWLRMGGAESSAETQAGQKVKGSRWSQKGWSRRRWRGRRPPRRNGRAGQGILGGKSLFIIYYINVKFLLFLIFKICQSEIFQPFLIFTKNSNH